MKRIITLLLIGMLAFSAFAGTQISSASLTINAKVTGKNPSYIMVASNTAGDITLENLSGTTVTATETHLTNDIYADGSSTTDANKTITFYLGIAQTESRFNSDVTLSLAFSKLTYAGVEVTKDNQKTTEKPQDTEYDPIPAPAVTATSHRSTTLALTVPENLTKDTTNSSGDTSIYTLDLDYSIFGYFMKDNTGLMTMEVVYTIPATITDSDTRASMPLGTYTGTVTLTATSK